MFLKPSEVFKYIALINELGYGVPFTSIHNVFNRPVLEVVNLVGPEVPVEVLIGEIIMTPIELFLDTDQIIIIFCLIASILEQDYDL